MTDLNPLLPPSGEPVPRKADDEAEAWLVRRSTIRLLWIVSLALLAGLTLLDLVVKKKPHFEAEGYFGFASVFGFVACVALVVGSKVVGALLKRKDTYYHD
ncbi:MAG: hypothetical protein AAGB15_09390 [Pseudomonadota bacterium]